MTRKKKDVPSIYVIARFRNGTEVSQKLFPDSARECFSTLAYLYCANASTDVVSISVEDCRHVVLSELHVLARKNLRLK